MCRRRLEPGTEPKLEADGDGRPTLGTRPKTRRRMKQAKMLTESVLLNHLPRHESGVFCFFCQSVARQVLSAKEHEVSKAARLTGTNNSNNSI